MANERGCNKKKRKQKKIEQLKRLLGIDLCACGGGNQLRCHGKCREVHTNPKTGRVECGECYRIDYLAVKQGGPRRPKRTWKYGRQKEGNENKQTKDRRHERWQRDRSE